MLRPDRRAEAVATKGRPKRGAATVDHLAEGSAWQTCAGYWRQIVGRAVRLAPTEGAGKTLAERVELLGDVLVRRLEYLACAPGPAESDRLWLSTRAGLSVVTRIDTEWTRDKDTAAEAWVAQGRPLQIAQNSPSRASGARGRPTSAREHWSAWDADAAEIMRRGEVIDADTEPRALLGVTHG